MIRIFFIVIALFLSNASFNYSNDYSSKLLLYTLYSENGKYYVKSIPYDNEIESLYGKSYVYKKGVKEPLYSIDRHFEYRYKPNLIHLSNDGQTIWYINERTGSDNFKQQKPITVYKSGKLHSSFDVQTLNGCDNDKEDCYLLYKNYKVIDSDSCYRKNDIDYLGFKGGTSEEEKFAIRSNVFAHQDTLYIIDKFKLVHRFDMNSTELLSDLNLDESISELRKKFHINQIEIREHIAPSSHYLPVVESGVKLYQVLAKEYKLKEFEGTDKAEAKYRKYRLFIDGIIDREGNLNILEFHCSNELPEEEIRELLSKTQFKTGGIPNFLEAWRYTEYMYFRPRSKLKAKKEKKEYEVRLQQVYQKRLTQDSIGGFYIPKNLGECMEQLDILLLTKHKEDMKSQKNREDMIKYHRSVGLYLRNNWGLWGGSRLQKYFSDRGIYHPDDMSAIILEYYHDWLNGDKDSWKEWETENPIAED